MSGRLARGRSLRAGRAGAGLRAGPGQGHRAGAGLPGAALPGPHRGAAADHGAVAPGRVRAGRQALFRAKLLAGEMPHEIEEVFAGCGTPLFPRLASDLDMRCSCPDWEVPCKHLAAVCYVLAEEFDRDPFAMLAWRGQGRDELLAALRRVQAPGSGPAAGPAGRPVARRGPVRRGRSREAPAAPLAGVRGGVLVRPAEPGPAARAGRAVRPRRPRPAAAHVPAAAGQGQGPGPGRRAGPRLPAGSPKRIRVSK